MAVIGSRPRKMDWIGRANGIGKAGGGVFLLAVGTAALWGGVGDAPSILASCNSEVEVGRKGS